MEDGDSSAVKSAEDASQGEQNSVEVADLLGLGDSAVPNDVPSCGKQQEVASDLLDLAGELPSDKSPEDIPFASSQEEPNETLPPPPRPTTRSRSLGPPISSLPPVEAALVTENELLRTEIEGWRLKFASLEEKTRQQFSVLENQLMGRIAMLETEKRQHEEEAIKQRAVLVERRKKLQGLLEERLVLIRDKLDQITGKVATLPLNGEETKKLVEQVSLSVEEELCKLQEEFKSKEDQLRERNAALLAEMNTMNEVIKQRGEKLSAMEAKEEEMKAEIDRLKVENEAKPSPVSTEATSGISSSTKPSTTDGEGDESAVQAAETASTATSEISMKEQAARMREVDASLEEYSQKLKLLAIKLKKRIVELEGEKKALVADLEKAKSTSVVKFQSEIDALQDALDSKTAELKQARKDLENAANKISGDSKLLADALEDKDKLMSELSAVKKAEAILTKERKELEAKIIIADRLVVEKDAAVASKTTELDSALSKLNDAEKKVLRLEDSVRTLEKDGDQSKKLETQIGEMEKTIADLTSKLDESTDKLLGSESSLKKAMSDLRSVATLLDREKEKSSTLHKTATVLKADLRESRKNEGELRTFRSQLSAEVEELNRQQESLKTQLNSLQVEVDESRELNRQREMELESELAVVKDSAETSKLELEKTRKSLETVEAEFESYKTRAKAVLRQHKQLKEDLEKREKMEQEGLNEQQEKLKAEFITQIETLRRETSKLEAEVAAAAAEKAALNIQLELKDAEFLALAESKKNHETDLEEAREKIESLNQALHQEKLSKKLVLDALAAKEELLSAVVEESSSTSTPTPMSQPNFSLPEDMRHMEREEGEGSECVTSPPIDTSSPTPIFKFIHGDIDDAPRSPTKLMPLDKLLAADEAEYDRYSGRGRRESTTSTSSHHQGHRRRRRSTRKFEEDEELMRDLKSSNAELRKKVNHLSSLLHDSEATNAKLVDLTEVLKEEIRKEQRNEERQKHLEQTEYIKNVFFKFMTLKSSNERERLIPVLTTMLRLSPQEKNCLLSVARGTDDEPSQPPGWSSYLGLWKQ